uniref:Uncharacterized protein n=1 Tax=Moniliophthora roreri TaxID=221103 RepID=A0A0W0F7U0_MONRR
MPDLELKSEIKQMKDDVMRWM